MPTKAYKIRIRTDSEDSHGLLLLANGELVAILVELADEIHGDARGQWTIEATFGLNAPKRPALFPSAIDAASWVSQNICSSPFAFDPSITEL